MSGYGNGRFGPDDPVTREQTAVILYQYAEYKELDISATISLSGYVDMKDISNWALDAMKWAVAIGIIEAHSANRTAPRGTSTRAEIAMIFKRYIEDFFDTDGDDDDSEK